MLENSKQYFIRYLKSTQSEMHPAVAFWIIGIVLIIVSAIIFPHYWGIGVLGGLSLILGAVVAIFGG